MSDLLVRLKLDEKGLDAQMKGVSSKFAEAARGIARIALPVAAIAAIAKSVDGLAAMGEAAINSIAPLHDQAQQLGVNAERLQELRLIAGNAGVSVEQFDKALGTLNRTLGQAALGQGQFEKMAKAAGVSIRDEQGNVKATSAVWDDLTKRVQSGALAQNTAIGLASAAFGREGGRMVAVLRQTADEQQRVIDTARQFGAIISNEVVAAADDYEDQLSLIKKGTEALDAQNKLILAPLTLQWAKLKNEISGAVAELSRAAGLIDDNTILMEKRLVNIKQIISDREAFLLKINVDPESDALIQNMSRELDELQKKLDYEKLIKTPFIQPKRPMEDADTSEDEKAAKEAARAELDLITAVYAEKERVAQEEMAQELEWATVLAEERERFYAQELEQEQYWSDTLAEERERAHDFEVEQYINKEGLLTEARKEGMNARLAFDQMESGKKVALAIGAIEQITAGVAQHSKKAFQLNKLAAIANAIINTAEGATKALAQGGFFGIAMAASVIAAGAAQIGAIKRTTYQGGGAGTTPSLAGSTPTLNGNPVQQSDRVITVRGVDKNMLYTGRQLIELVNEAMRDGAKLVLQT